MLEGLCLRDQGYQPNALPEVLARVASPRLTEGLINPLRRGKLKSLRGDEEDLSDRLARLLKSEKAPKDRAALTVARSLQP
jgi:hypothetical protein